MREIKGYIVLHKKLLDWQWYDEINTKVLFIHCLLMANYEPNEWRGVIINRGQFITSVNSLSEQTGLSTQKIRTSLQNLISTKEIIKKSTNKYTMLTICKYDSYQKAEKKDNKQKTIEQQTNNIQITTTKEYKELNNKNIIKSFKQFTEEDFKKDISECVLNGNDDFQNFWDMINIQNFSDHWLEKNTTGKMKFQLQQTWQTNLRMNKWKNNNFNKGGNNGTAHSNDRTTHTKFNQKEGY